MPKIQREGKIYLGIDPGCSGGMAAIALDGVEALAMPATERDVWDWFAFYLGRDDVVASVEKVGGYVQGNASPGSAMFKFGAGYGGLRMALVAARIPFEEVTPQRWQKEFVVHRKKSESKTVFKNRLKAKAQQLFPGIKVTLGTADALLIAEYTRRKWS